jgi:hypothetical protein
MFEYIIIEKRLRFHTGKRLVIAPLVCSVNGAFTEMISAIANSSSKLTQSALNSGSFLLHLPRL